MERKRAILIALLALVFLVSGGMMIRQQLEYQKIAAASAEAAQVAGLPEQIVPPRPAAPAGMEVPAPPEEAPEELPEELPEEPPEEPSEEPSEALPDGVAALAGLNLKALREVNADVVGWIAIPGTELSYPLVQGRDNQYYLKRNWKKESSAGGSVFLESTNNRELTDFHTIAYAHRMRNDTMFGTLKYYKDLDFWQEHPCVYVATEAGVYCYDIFAAQEAGVKGVVYRLDMEESGLEEEFLQYCVEGSVIDTGIIPEAGDRILTLSTCTGNGHATRWVVHAVLRDVWAEE